ncbi:unnamed protein product [Linum trigynum]|uniref:F-box domain-containing protein n=1 Tax=Linum trigynum TaxID=586398 RepID=A0AAV2CUA5_9ROSI
MASCICFGSKQNDRDDQRDKISQLSDDIIHHILRSTNSTKTAARTSLLSRRWRDLWRCYPVLEFHGGGDSCSVGKERASSFFSPRRWRNSCPSPAAEEAASFCRFVAAASSRLPLLLPLPLVEFRISIVSESCHDYVD